MYGTYRGGKLLFTEALLPVMDPCSEGAGDAGLGESSGCASSPESAFESGNRPTNRCRRKLITTLCGYFFQIFLQSKNKSGRGDAQYLPCLSA